MTIKPHPQNISRNVKDKNAKMAAEKSHWMGSIFQFILVLECGTINILIHMKKKHSECTKYWPQSLTDNLLHFTSNKIPLYSIQVFPFPFLWPFFLTLESYWKLLNGSAFLFCEKTKTNPKILVFAQHLKPIRFSNFLISNLWRMLHIQEKMISPGLSNLVGRIKQKTLNIWAVFIDIVMICRRANTKSDSLHFANLGYLIQKKTFKYIHNIFINNTLFPTNNDRFNYMMFK